MDLAEVIGHLALLRRFPIEPLGGETPNELVIADESAVGDRAYELVDADSGKPLEHVTTPWLFSYSVRFLEDLVARDLSVWTRVRTPEGREFALDDREWLDEVSDRLERRVALKPREASSPQRGMLHLLSRPTVRLLERAYGGPLDPLWFRANFLVELTDAKAFDEDGWIGNQVRIGDALCDVIGPSRECLALAHRPSPPGGDLAMLEGLLKVRGGALGVSVRARSGHRVRVADPVSLVH